MDEVAVLAIVATELSESAVAVPGLDSLTGVRDGSAFSTPGRVTFVIAKRGLANRPVSSLSCSQLSA
jgi:hypothetical protein